jgi:hypothetical protein
MVRTIQNQIGRINFFYQRTQFHINDSSGEGCIEVPTDETVDYAKLADQYLEGINRAVVLEEEAICALVLTNDVILKPGDLATYGIAFDSADLKVSGETSYQGAMDVKNIISNYLVKTSNSNLSTPMPTLHADYYAFAGKADAISIARPLSFEQIGESRAESYNKGRDPFDMDDYGVLLRGFQRVLGLAAVNCHLTNIVALCATCRYLSVVVFRRCWHRSSSYTAPVLVESLRVIRGYPDATECLWAKLTKEAVLDPTVMYCDAVDSFHATRFLSRIARFHGYCRTLAVAASGAKVFSVTFPTQSRGDIIIKRKTNEFAIKIVQNDFEFENEVSCLSQFHDYLQQNDPQAARSFYALGYWKSTDENPVYFGDWSTYFEDLRDQMEQLLCCGAEQHHGNTADPCAWWELVPAEDDVLAEAGFHSIPGGIIIMRSADVLSDVAHRSKLLGSLIADSGTWMERIHAAGLLHCDVRWRNILYFPALTVENRSDQVVGKTAKVSLQAEPGFQIVDFGLGAILRDGATAIRRTVDKRTGQFANAGQRLKECADSVSTETFKFDWMAWDDRDMLRVAYAKLAAELI